jgi:hypothetical protein
VAAARAARAAAAAEAEAPIDKAHPTSSLLRS